MSNTSSTTTTKTIDIKLTNMIGTLNENRLIAMESNINLNPSTFDAEKICRFICSVLENYIVETEICVCVNPTRLVFSNFFFLDLYGSMLKNWVIDECIVTQNKWANTIEIELLCHSKITPITVPEEDISDEVKEAIFGERPGSVDGNAMREYLDKVAKLICEGMEAGYDDTMKVVSCINGYDPKKYPETSANQKITVETLRKAWEDATKDDPVNHPSHYTSMSIETIDLMEEAEGREAVEDYCICNCWKYLSRHGKKDDDIQDMKKLVWYANRYIQMKEEDEDVD